MARLAVQALHGAGPAATSGLAMRDGHDVRDNPEWLDLKALQRHACVSERTLREWIHRP